MFLLCPGVLAVLGLTLSAADAGAAQAGDANLQVVFETTAGSFTIELDKAKAPITVENFLKYVDSGYYDGLTFHRVIPGFMIQGGGLDDKMQEKTEGARPPIKNEASNGLSNKRGTLSMARTNNPDSATSQFFVNVVDNARSLDPRPGSAGYAVFARVVKGMEVVDAIVAVPTGNRGQHGDVPLKPVYMKSVKRKPKS